MIKIIRRLRKLKNLSYLPGHYYSPVVMPEELYGYENRIFSKEKVDLPGIDLNENGQLNLLKRISRFYSELPFKFHKNEDLRYYYDNDYFSYNSAIQLYGILREFNPERVIEIGSGFSSALMLDTNDIFMEGKIKFTFIEPNPDRLHSLLKKGDKNNHVVLESKIQDVHNSLFAELKENDILFIDSSHVAKTGSDLNKIFFEIIPMLNKGVIIHFHDIFYPFEYPVKWVLQKGGFGWNENYILHAYLMYNTQIEIILFNSFMEQFYEKWFVENMPDCLKRQGGSIFLRKK